MLGLHLYKARQGGCMVVVPLHPLRLASAHVGRQLDGAQLPRRHHLRRAQPQAGKHEVG